MPNYRSLMGGFFSATPLDKSSGPTSIRCNNPGAVNGAAWEKKFPGYVDTVVTTPGNATTIFETPEQGVAAWWELLRRYRNAGAITVQQIVTKYGGGQDYSAYLDWVVVNSGLRRAQSVDLKDDELLLKLARAMFKYEAGTKIPWSDAQILYGFNLGRQYAGVKAPAPGPSSKVPSEAPLPPMSSPAGPAAAVATGLAAVLAAAAYYMEIGMLYIAVFVAGYVASIFTWALLRDKMAALIDKWRSPPAAPPPAV